jgi:putative adenylate-forming enzyme
MNLLLADLLLRRTGQQGRLRWSRSRLMRFQSVRLHQLRQHAMQRSPFLAEYHRHLDAAPLKELPPMTKSTLMEFWDELVTAPSLRRELVERNLAERESDGTDPSLPWRGRWWMAATGGSTGERGVFVWDRREWVSILASYARVNDWAGVRVGPGHPLPTAIVSTRNPTHQSAVVGASIRSRLVPTLRVNATDPLEQIVNQLNRFRPRLLVCYASMLAPLAEAQLAGSLRIAPEKVITASEELLPAAQRMAVHAWGVDVLNTYAATETATIASMCPMGSLHLYEDFVLVEPVDAAYRAVPDGQLADRLLVTVLFSRTLPLIRYELDDSVRLATRACPCGSPYRVLETVIGRTESCLRLTANAGGAVVVRPDVFHDAVGPLAVHGWQVRQLPNGLAVRVLDPDHHLDLPRIRSAVLAGLCHAGVGPDVPIDVEPVSHLDRTRLGKTPLIVPWSASGTPSRS